MVTVSAMVYEHHKNADGTYNLKICVHQKSERKFIDTVHFVVRKQLTKELKIKEINSNMLMAYERYMRSERTMTRINQMGNKVTTNEKGLSDSGLHNQMRDLCTLFNAASDHYNNEDLGIYRIKHYPLRKYKVGSPSLTKKRNNTLEQVLAICDCATKPGSRAELAKELYMLSFYLCGMIAVDYNRSKTEGKLLHLAVMQYHLDFQKKYKQNWFFVRTYRRFPSRKNLKTDLHKLRKYKNKWIDVNDRENK